MINHNDLLKDIFDSFVPEDKLLGVSILVSNYNDGDVIYPHIHYYLLEPFEYCGATKIYDGLYNFMFFNGKKEVCPKVTPLDLSNESFMLLNGYLIHNMDNGVYLLEESSDTHDLAFILFSRDDKGGIKEVSLRPLLAHPDEMEEDRIAFEEDE